MKIDEEIKSLEAQIAKTEALKSDCEQCVVMLGKPQPNSPVLELGLANLNEWATLQQTEALRAMKERLRKMKLERPKWIINFEKESREANLNIGVLVMKARTRTQNKDGAIANEIKIQVEKFDSEAAKMSQGDKNDFYFGLKDLLANLI